MSPDPDWMFRRSENSLLPAEIRTLDHPAHSLVTIPTTLSWLSHIKRVVTQNKMRSLTYGSYMGEIENEHIQLKNRI
jgi:hypothetical protein